LAHVRHGALELPLPVGLVYDPVGHVALDPDGQARGLHDAQEELERRRAEAPPDACEERRRQILALATDFPAAVERLEDAAAGAQAQGGNRPPTVATTG
jgi:hypothetical protein